jgi:hypothetical protein
MDFPNRLTIPAEVMARQVGEELVILDLASGNYFGLDPVGARIWRLFTEGKLPIEVRDILLTEYDVGREQLEQDIGRLIDELSAKGLLKLD